METRVTRIASVEGSVVASRVIRAETLRTRSWDPAKKTMKDRTVVATVSALEWP